MEVVNFGAHPLFHAQKKTTKENAPAALDRCADARSHLNSLLAASDSFSRAIQREIAELSLVSTIERRALKSTLVSCVKLTDQHFPPRSRASISDYECDLSGGESDSHNSSAGGPGLTI